MNRELDKLYLNMLKFGFVLLRQAASIGQYRWLEAELELLHNVPSLIGEVNVSRHLYFWREERDMYLTTLSEIGSADICSRSKAYYSPIWHEMEPIMQRMIGSENWER
jgi:hypothetical protein